MTNDNATDELRDMWQSQKLETFQMSPEQRALMLRRVNRQFRIWYSPLIPASILLVLAAAVGVLFHFNALSSAVAWFHFHSWTVRVGFCLMFLGVGYGFLQQSRYVKAKNSSFAKAETSGNTGSLDFYQTELERELNRCRLVWSRLAFVPGFLIMEFGMTTFIQGNSRWVFAIIFFSTLLVVLILAIYFNSRESRKYQRKIDALQALRRTKE